MPTFALESFQELPRIIIKKQKQNEEKKE